VKKTSHLIGILMLVPCIVLISALMLYPVAVSLKMSFYRETLTGLRTRFIGFSNYAYLWQDRKFIAAFLRGFIWVGGTLTFQTLLGLGAALLLNQKFIGRGFARGCVLLPFFLPGVSIYLVWRWMYNDLYGVINQALLDLHLIQEPVLWLSSIDLALWALIFMAGWIYFPFVTINILARLQTIEPQLYEAARIDGASFWKCFVHITLPQVRSVLLVVILLRALWMFNKFNEIWIVTAGGPAGSTTTLPILAFKEAFKVQRLGRASAITTTLFILVLAVATIYLVTFKPAKEVT